MLYAVSIGIFFAIIMTLVLLLYVVEKKVVAAGDCKVLINGDESKSPVVSAGTNLLSALSDESIFIPSACGGGGSCAMCKVKVVEGGGDILPTELPHLSIAERKEHVRLGCQVKVKEDIKIEIPDEIFSIQKFECEVISNENVATFIKELKLKLPASFDLGFRAGGYIQIYIPPYNLQYNQFDIEDEYKGDWEKFSMYDIKASNDEEVFRAYSMANYPEEVGVVYLNVRIASPPPGQDVPAGIGSSFIFNLKPGDKVMLSGPYGEFYAKETNLVHTSPDIRVGYAKNRNARAVSAGLRKFLPVPPNTSLPIITPKVIPTAACQRGIVGGRVNGNSNPVTKNPSFISCPLITAPRNSHASPTA